MTDYGHIDHLIDWANTFDSSLLLSEDDVETKFVLPFFRCLGYPEENRRGKYPVNKYQSGKPGRKEEADHVYFSVSEPDKQNADTALVLVEAKRAQAHNLEGAVNQADHYAEQVKPLFLVVTDGYHLKIIKRHRYHSNEVVRDITIQELRARNTAALVYNQLQFETVKRLKEQAIDPLTYAQYVETMQTLDRYPDIRELLAKGDFEPSTKQEGRQLIVVKPKAAITCELPIAFEEGSCQIEFSSIMLRGFTCHLSHSEILTQLFIGLGTPPNWETRPFLHKTEQKTFEARLGQTSIILSENEANDLCETVDVVCQKYRDILIETTNALETWDYRPVSIEDERGFELLSVEQWLWDLMKQFSREFDYDNGNSDWHIFDSHHSWAIRVARRGCHDHVIIWPKFGGSFFPSREVDLLYVDSITYLQLYRDKSDDSIFENVGPNGVWTAKYTREWIERQFIPKVLSYYATSRLIPKSMKLNGIKRATLKAFPTSKLSQKWLNAIMREAIQDYRSEEQTPLTYINEPKQFFHYLHQIQSWFHTYNFYGTSNISALLLRPYYAAFSELARDADPTLIDMHYVGGNLEGVKFRTEQNEDINNQSDLSTYDGMMKFLGKQVTRIYEADYENNQIADYLTCAFIGIIKVGIRQVEQNKLNKAKNALNPLLEQYRFEQHFIEPIIIASISKGVPQIFARTFGVQAGAFFQG